MKHTAVKNIALELNPSESERLASLKKYQILGTEREPCFDVVSEMAALIAKYAASAICFIDERKLWIKSSYGISNHAYFERRISYESALSLRRAIKLENPEDQEFFKKSKIQIDGKAIKHFYGLPILNKEGHLLGIFCLFDFEGKRPHEDWEDAMHLLVQELMMKLDDRRAAFERDQALEDRSDKLIRGHIKFFEQGKELEKAQSGFERQSSLLQSIMDNSPHLFTLFDSDGNYRLANEAVLNSLQISPDQLLGKHISEVKGAQLSQSIASLKKVLRTGSPSTPFDEVVVKDGQEKHYQVVMIPVENGPGKPLVLRIATDITDLKLLEGNLHKKNKELENLIYSLSHDLRGPISSILGLTNMEKYVKPDEMSKYFSMIQEQALKMDTSIHDLVELKTVTNKNVSPEVVKVDELLSSILKEIDTEGINVEIEGNPMAVISTDKFFLTTALQRVLENAVQYHEQGAKDARVNISVKDLGSRLRMIIADNGLGISPKAMPRIFEMFYRGSNNSNGHGLGLYIAQNALSRIKGKIEISSEEGAGTMVTLSVPKVEGDAFFD